MRESKQKAQVNESYNEGCVRAEGILKIVCCIRFVTFC